MKRSAAESPTVRSYRELLGVGPTATADELKKAYHKLALLYHPDRNPGPNAAAEFQKVREAFDILNDAPMIRALNENHLREKLFNQVVEGINICFGSFFGYRVFGGPEGRTPKALRLGQEKVGESDVDPFDRWNGPIEQDSSILDNPAYDSIETVYAGRFSMDDEERLQDSVRGSQASQLPWVVLNNQGILHFLDGDIKRATKCYEELNRRIPNNIIFMYRLGLCHVITGFREPKRTFLGFLKPDRIEIEKGLNLFRKCIRIGETRPIGKQRCIVIRKTMADVLEKTGRKRKAMKIWREIHDFNPKSIEATLKARGLQAAKEQLSGRLQRKTAQSVDSGTTKLIGRTRTNR